MRPKDLLKKLLTPGQIESLRRARRQAAPFLLGGNLPALCEIFGTDKWGDHRYAEIYQRHFEPLRTRRLKILEIGVGGDEDPARGGASLRVWKAYFPRSEIFGIDLHEKQIRESRITVFRGDQSDPSFLTRVVREMGGVDIVIDDGSHVNSHVIKSFETLFPLLSEAGIYVVEDTQTSYWPGMGGSSENLSDPTTIMGYFKGRLDGLNYPERIRPGYSPSLFDRRIVSIHFYHNLIVVFKGTHDGTSNVLRNNSTELGWVLGPNRRSGRFGPAVPGSP